MEQKTISLRLDAHFHEELKVTSQLTKTSMNQLIVESIQSYLPKKRAFVQAQLEGILDRLRGFEKRGVALDEQARKEFAATEAELAGEDPVEGTLFHEEEGLPVVRQLEKFLAAREG